MLTPSQKVTLMTEVGRRLAAEDWSVLDLTLRQFSVPTLETWSGGTFEYAIGALENATEQQLLDLAAHVGFQFADRPSAIEPSFWEAGYFRLFISHISEFKEDAAALHRELLKRGVSGFVAHSAIEPTREWLTEIEVALNTADALVALLRTGFHESPYTDQEVGAALGRGILIVPVRYEIVPYGLFGRYQALPGTGREASAVAEALLEIFLGHKLTEKRMSEAIVAMFEGSNTYNQARANMALVEGLRYFDAQLAARVERAVETNLQLKDEFSMPDRVKRLIAKWKA